MRYSRHVARAYMWAALVGALILHPCDGLRAAQWVFTPSISVSEEYDSNVTFRSEDEISDFVTVVRPKLLLMGNTEQTRFRLDSTTSAEKYAENDNLDTVNTNTRTSLEHQWTSRFSTALTGGFVRDTTLETQLEEAGVTSVRAERNRYDVGLTETYALTETLSLSVTESGGQTFYPDRQLPESSQWQVLVGPTWAINERNSLGSNLSYAVNDYVDTATITNLGNLLYWKHALNETTSFTLGGGYRITWTERSVLRFELDEEGGVILVQRQEKSTDGGMTALAVVDKTWTDRFSTSLSAGMDQYSSAEAESFERMYIRTHFKYGVSPRTSFNCEARYDRNTGTDEQSEDTDYFRIAPSVSRKFTENLSLRLAGSYDHELRSNSVGDSTAQRFRASLEVSYLWPELWASR